MEEKYNAKTLEKEGWKKQFVTNEPRLSEAVEMYQQAGFEVRLEPLPPNSECETCEDAVDENECRICFEGVEDQYKIIYTRKNEEAEEANDDLF